MSCRPKRNTRTGSTASRLCASRSPSGCRAAWCRTRPWPRSSTGRSTTWSKAASKADASPATAARPRARRTGRRRAGSRAEVRRRQDSAGRRAVRRERQLRADRRGRRPVLHLPARADRRVPGRPEAARSCSRRARCGCPAATARTGSTSSTGATYCATRRSDRLAAYRRVLGYGRGARRRAEPAEHRLPHAVRALRQPGDAVLARQADQRRDPRAGLDPSFGSIAVVRRAGLDLRNNLKFTSFGHLNVLRVEVMQVLDECFRILGLRRRQEPVRRRQRLGRGGRGPDPLLRRAAAEPPAAADGGHRPGRPALAGRPHIMETTRGEFEALLMDIAEPAEEWLHDRAGDEPGAAHRQRPGAAVGATRPVGARVAVRGTVPVAMPPAARRPMYPHRGGLGTYRGGRSGTAPRVARRPSLSRVDGGARPPCATARALAHLARGRTAGARRPRAVAVDALDQLRRASCRRCGARGSLVGTGHARPRRRGRRVARATGSRDRRRDAR